MEILISEENVFELHNWYMYLLLILDTIVPPLPPTVSAYILLASKLHTL
jgi:hypothetical protein